MSTLFFFYMKMLYILYLIYNLVKHSDFIMDIE